MTTIGPNYLGGSAMFPGQGAVSTNAGGAGGKKQRTFSRGPDGGLVVNGGDGEDRINVALGGKYGKLTIDCNGKKRVLSKKQAAKGITLNGNGGDDMIKVAPEVNAPLRINGGRGNNKIENGASGAQIDVGEFGTVLNKGNFADITGGELGANIKNDSDGTKIRAGGAHPLSIDSKGSFNEINGSAGDDQIASAGDYNQIDGWDGDDQFALSGSFNQLRAGSRSQIVSNGDFNRFQLGDGSHDFVSSGAFNQFQLGNGRYRGAINGPFNSVIGGGSWGELGCLGPQDVRSCMPPPPARPEVCAYPAPDAPPPAGEPITKPPPVLPETTPYDVSAKLSWILSLSVTAELSANLRA